MKIYEKPDVEYVTLTAQEAVASVVDGSTDVKSNTYFD